MEPKKSTNFIAGFYSNDITDKTPEFIYGSGSIQPEALMKWLEENKHLAVNGYIPYQILKSAKTGKRYVCVDQWKIDNYKPASEMPSVKNTDDDLQKKIEGIPF